MSEKEPINISAEHRTIVQKIGGVVGAMGRGFEAQTTDKVGTRTIALDVMTGHLEQADVALKLTPVPDAPPKDL